MRPLSEIRERVRSLLFRSAEEREMEEELRFHVEMEVEQNLRRGMTPEEARRRALIKIGGIERVKERVRDARGTRPLEDSIRNIRLAFRRIVREPGWSVPTVATLALGIGALTAAFALAWGVLLRPLPYPDAERLVEVRHAAPRAELSVTGLSSGTFLRYRDGNRVFDGIGVYQGHLQTLTDEEVPERVRAARVSPGLLEMLGAEPHLGRLPLAADVDGGAGEGVVISHALWVRRYGADPGLVGREIEIERRREVVVGVTRPGFHFPHAETHLWRAWPQEAFMAQFGGPRAGLGGLFMSSVARLRPGVSPEEAKRDVDRLIATLPDIYPDVTGERLREMGLRAELVPLKDTVVGDVRTPILVLLTTASLLLLISLANVANLSLVRAERLRREVAVLRALGAGEARLAGRFLSESLLLALAGGVVGLFLAWLAVRGRFGLQPEQVPRLGEVGLDAVPAGVGAGLALMVGGLLAVVTLVSVRRRPATGVAGLRTGGTAGSAGRTGRRALVVTQVALALALLVGSALATQSFWRLTRVDLGFEREGRLSFQLPVPLSTYRDHDAAAALHARILERVAALPGVEAVGAATTGPFPLAPVRDWMVDRVSLAAGAETDSVRAPLAIFGFATPGYFGTMGIPLVEGRGLETSDAAGATSGVVVSRSLAQALFGDGSALGQEIFLGTGDMALRVVGVAGDVPSRTVENGPGRVVYLPNVVSPGRDTGGAAGAFIARDEIYVVRTSLPPLSVLPAVREAVAEVDPKLAVIGPRTLDDLVARSTALPRVTMLLLLVSALAALALGLVGIYGVLAYTVRRREAELGVRLALGASPQGMIRSVVREGASVALAGILLGLAASLALGGLLRSLLYGISPFDPATLAAAGLLLFAVAVAASWVPARRAGRIDPARALRSD